MAMPTPIVSRPPPSFPPYGDHRPTRRVKNEEMASKVALLHVTGLDSTDNVPVPGASGRRPDPDK
ncbi:hypothetical protein RRF57_002338 [Xylaria bambusicola]|uniref:Uncharacterized protein n=1 Tax=Xylaria bambusicola TaxID=326684 RepID=A0AAN7UDG1_9PEZI